ncbi:UDP-glucose 4-epimerase GalE [Polynucleobacter sp. HIN8]|uniref:UDP-glucose 4-epimerase GalE n=1 Tax=Polynucleobacter sp. HIN8 TaxID=3047867 RepID=UPI0025743044|nr:UDP-glucose 4-epimerase GalE [Polynucleobacter sp. HIN8]BEI38907.1 UDP-glucose 4-epimerase GalE [Polynucleobacter sp. HIN8]
MILLTGATGYIGSHIWAELLQNKFAVIGVDNLSNSSTDVLASIESISSIPPVFFLGDVRDEEFLINLFKKNQINLVIHLAALKDIQQSALKEIEYFDVNVNGLKNVLRVMNKFSCKKIIFSSSASVYDPYTISPKDEFSYLNPLSIYGKTKLDGEKLIYESNADGLNFQSMVIRYFNVEGRHPSGLLTSNIHRNSGSLFSEIHKHLSGEQDFLPIYGDDWGTNDGTCIRDYIHVSDVASGNTKVINLFNRSSDSFVFNFGTGFGNSVKNVISACEQATGKHIYYKIYGKRAHEVGISYANIAAAKKVLGWSPNKTIQDICSSSLSMYCS